MAISRCPGQDSRYFKSEDVFDAPCPNCGRTLEFWKNEPRRRCVGCGKNVANPKFDAGCAKWCKFAKDCLGLTPQAGRDESLCEGLIGQMKKAFSQDRERIGRTLTVLDYAETILRTENADPLVVKAAAVLCDIGAREAQPSDGQTEGSSAVREILGEFEIDPGRVEQILRAVSALHGAGDIDTKESRIVRDARRLADMPREHESEDRPQHQRGCKHSSHGTQT